MFHLFHALHSCRVLCRWTKIRSHSHLYSKQISIPWCSSSKPCSNHPHFEETSQTFAINIHPTHSPGRRMRTFNCCKIKRNPIFEYTRQLWKKTLSLTYELQLLILKLSFLFLVTTKSQKLHQGHQGQQSPWMAVLKSKKKTSLMDISKSGACIDSSSNLENPSTSICKMPGSRIDLLQRK